MAKMAKYNLDQIKDIIGMHEETMMKFFNSTVERLELKITKLTEENVYLKKEVQELKESVEFQSTVVEDTKSKINSKNDEDIKDKLSELEDRSRRNNLRVNGLEEDDNESWDESEKKVRELFEEELKVKNISIERAHRSGRKRRDDGTTNRRRPIVIKFLNYKEKVNVLTQFKKKKLWEKKIYMNEGFSERTVAKRKELFKKVKELRERGITNAKVVYNKIIYSEVRDGANENK